MVENVSREDIADLLKTIERYNPGNLNLFVSYVHNTATNGTYDIEAYLAVLKLYQFNTHKFDMATTKTILLKTLTALPDTDFTLCLYLLPAERHEALSDLIYLAHCLDMCHFDKFWAFIEENPDVLKAKVLIESEEEDQDGSYVDVEIAGFKDAIRQYVAHVINSTYQTVSKDTISTMLGGLSGTALTKFCEKQGWTEKNGSLFVSNQEAVTSKNIVEKISLQSLTTLMAGAQF